MRKPAPDAVFGGSAVEALSPCGGDESMPIPCNPHESDVVASFYRPDESTRLARAESWLAVARAKAPRGNGS